jgi:hypothetical protein
MFLALKNDVIILIPCKKVYLDMQAIQCEFLL